MASLKAFPVVNSLARRRRAGAQALLQHRLRGRHAERPRRPGRSRTSTARACSRSRSELTELSGKARAGKLGRRRHAGRDVHDLVAGRHRRHRLHADRQRARGGDPRRHALGDEAGLERLRVRAAADAPAVAVLRPPRDRRRARRALHRAPGRTCSPTCEGCCCDARSRSRTSATSTTSPSSRCWSPSATRSRSRTRWSCSSPTRRRWRSRRRRRARSREQRGRGRRHGLRGLGAR